MLLPRLPSLLSVANMHLHMRQPHLAIPLYAYVLRHAAHGSRELEMARPKGLEFGLGARYGAAVGFSARLRSSIWRGPRV